MHNAWTKEAPEHLYKSRRVAQLTLCDGCKIRHNYRLINQMHPVYSPLPIHGYISTPYNYSLLPQLFIPRLRLGVNDSGGCIGAYNYIYPPRMHVWYIL